MGPLWIGCGCMRGGEQSHSRNQVQDTNDSSELWEILQTLLPNLGEQRVAYLLFHSGLKPGELVRFCSQEFPDIEEIYHLRRTILKRLLRNADQLRWQLTLID